jgi:hypothetical protein
MNETLKKAVNFAVNNPKYFDYAEIYLELKHTLRDFHDATLHKDWDKAYDLSITLVDLSHELEDAAQRMLYEQK